MIILPTSILRIRRKICRFLPADFEPLFRFHFMKRVRRWQRIFILFFLSISVSAPIFLLGYRLQNLTSNGREEFVEDLPNIKNRADVLPLRAVEQEGRKGVKEPHLEVYKDHNHSVVNLSPKKDSRAGGGGRRTYGSDRRATEELGIRGESKPFQPREVPPPRKLKGRSHQSSSQHDHGARVSPATTVPHGQDSRTRTRRLREDKVKQMRDQVITAKAYLSFATSAGNNHLVRELRIRLKDVERVLSHATDSDLSRRSLQKMKNMEHTLSKARSTYSNCSDMISRLRSMANEAEDHAQLQRNQTTFLTGIAGRTTPKGLHCLSMRLTTEYFTLEPGQQEFPNQQNVYDSNLLHYAVFSDNVLAVVVVVNSTVSNALEPEKIVFHVLTDSLNFPAISMWFLLNPLEEATIHVQSVKDFEQLSATYDLYRKKQRSNDSRFFSLLNHLRFYLPKIFPKLDKILLLDHDVVVQKDLSGLFTIDMTGKVNGAVETCQGGKPSYRQMDVLINFSDPWVATKFDAKACTWAFGMNLFDLRQWRQKDLTASYHRMLLRGNGKPLWSAGSLPLGWITFYNETLLLDRKWHLLGLGYDPQVKTDDIKQAAVIHYDGIKKPWLDIGINTYKSYWNKYLNFDQPLLQQCNLHG